MNQITLNEINHPKDFLFIVSTHTHTPLMIQISMTMYSVLIQIMQKSSKECQDLFYFPQQYCINHKRPSIISNTH